MPSLSMTNAGLNFSDYQTPGANMASELLDHYEEGTWSPTYSTTGVSSTLAMISQIGHYERVGGCVTAWFQAATNTSTWNGTYIQFGDLPFAVTDTRVAGFIAQAYNWAGQTPRTLFLATTTRMYVSYRDTSPETDAISRADDATASGSTQNLIEGVIICKVS